MPAKYHNEKIPRVKGIDKRIKLSDEDKEQIRKEWNPNTSFTNGKQEGSIHSLAEKYGVSRRLISSIVRNKPIKQLTYKEKKELNWESESKTKRNHYSKKFRQHQKEIYNSKEKNSHE